MLRARGWRHTCDVSARVVSEQNCASVREHTPDETIGIVVEQAVSPTYRVEYIGESAAAVITVNEASAAHLKLANPPSTVIGKASGVETRDSCRGNAALGISRHEPLPPRGARHCELTRRGRIRSHRPPSI